MGKGKKHHLPPHLRPTKNVVATETPSKRVVDSMLDAMMEGNEYGSLIDVLPGSTNLRDELRRAIGALEAARQRPTIVYAANVIKPGDVPTGIVLSDDLPFSEMIANVDASAQAVDVVLVTPGGLAQQVSQFVSRMRPRFRDVAFLLPQMAMSAGTIWAMSGNEIWMDERATLGPIDPQVQGRDGRFLPAQGLLALLKVIQEKGEERLKAGQSPAWSDVQILRNMDPKELGDALTSSSYSIQLASNYLENHKFRDWTVHSDGVAVTPAERHDAAVRVATKLCSHEDWKTHSHGISRDVANVELRLKIAHPETIPGVHSALRRFWALLYWTFENTSLAKIFLSQQYSLFRMNQVAGK